MTERPGLLDNYKMVGVSVSIQPCAETTETAIFHDVQPYDVLEVPRRPGMTTGLKAFGKKRRLGQRHCRVDALTGLVQVHRPPASGVVRLEWIRLKPMRSLGQASSVHLSTTTTYKEPSNG